MKTKKISELIKFSQGMNVTRLKNQNLLDEKELYGWADFENDLVKMAKLNLPYEMKDEQHLKAGDLIISSTKQVAARVSKENTGKFATMNFFKAEWMSSELDPNYFVYLFNGNREFRKNLDIEAQGSGTMKKITINSLHDLKIPLPPLNKQKKIGDAYVTMLKLKHEHQKMAELTEIATLGVLSQKLMERPNDK